MCRLSAITSSFPQRIDALDRMMLVAQTDENQGDGCGLSDGHVVYKSVLGYSSTVLGIFTSEINFQPEHILMGHVRKASAYTGRTRDESHPYMFTTRHGKLLIAAHNGYVQGTPYHTRGNPDTDSWRAFDRLVTLLNATETGDLTQDVMESWLREYEAKSTMAFLIHYDGALYAFRHNKPLHAMTVGDGYIINTSKNILAVVAAWLLARHKVTTGEIFELPEEALLTLHHDSLVIEKTDLRIDYKPVYVYPVQQVSSKSSTTSTTQTGSAPEPTGSSPPQNPIVVTNHNVLTPMDTIDLRRLSPRAMAIKAAANPMRSQLFMYWLQTSMSIESLQDPASVVQSISDEDFDLFQLQVGTWSKRQRQLINEWNRQVERTNDINVHDSLFGESWFWLDPFYIAPDITDEDAVKRLHNDITRKETV